MRKMLKTKVGIAMSQGFLNTFASSGTKIVGARYSNFRIYIFADNYGEGRSKLKKRDVRPDDWPAKIIFRRK